jgi:hypothetical protein
MNKKQLAVIKAVAEAVRELKQVPAGHLYASLMGIMSLAEFNSIIAVLVEAGLVERAASHMLTWVEPKA